MDNSSNLDNYQDSLLQTRSDCQREVPGQTEGSSSVRTLPRGQQAS